MKLVGLGGGIGSGKSTVSLLFAKRGAVIVDADLVAREVVEPDGPAYRPLIERFGEGILLEDKTLNRKALAAIVFNDPVALADLNAITHPEIEAGMARQIKAHHGTDRIVVLDAALLFDSIKAGMVGTMVVDVDPEVAVQRLVAYRGFTEDDARARIRSQMTREERLALTDFVIDNSRTPEDLEAEVDAAWAWIATLPDSPEDADGRPVRPLRPARPTGQDQANERLPAS